MLRIGLIAVAGLTLAATTAHADDVAVGSTIESVIVYPQGASVTRSIAFELMAGTSTLVISDIPAGLNTSSIRVEGLADAGLEIRSVETGEAAKADTAGDPEREALLDQVEALRDELQGLGDLQGALEAQRSFIQNLITEGPRGFGALLGADGSGIETWSRAWETLGQGLADVMERIRRIQLEQRAINEEIEALMQQIAALPVDIQRLAVRVEVDAAAATSGELTLSYRVASARWAPAYDATLTTGDADTEPAIEVVRRAEIVQQTGEDWTDVELTLSTTRPAGGTEAPVIGPGLVQVWQPGRFAGEADAMPAMAPAPPMDAVMGGVAAPVVAREQQAIADFGDFRADFIIPTPVSIASGSSVRSVRLGTEELDATLFVDATPRYSEQAYLTAAFTAPQEAPFLAGSVNLFRDGAYVGTGSLPFTNPGEDVELGFGPDDQVRVTYALVSRETGEQGLLTRYRTDEREYAITVDNGHSRAIEIRVTDRIPYAEDERITVERLPQTTEPTEENVDGLRGVLAWSYEYAPDESREITIAWRMIWPADLSISGAD
ncbi:MAG: mucoidy inhibitor MuiA family protein [Bauldia sp.]|nr:mucoidy inhibitor MuiA family protein [Bauldia sp.]